MFFGFGSLLEILSIQFTVGRQVFVKAVTHRWELFAVKLLIQGALWKVLGKLDILYGLRAARGTGSAKQQTTQVGSIAKDIEGHILTSKISA